MNKVIKTEDIKRTLRPVKEKYGFDAVLYGSVIDKAMRPTSDIDIAVLTYSGNDLRVFELLPIYIQISIVENYQVIFGDILEISEYFYKFRKKWDDCKHRILSNQFKSYKERLSLMKKD
ncbi:MAG: nucleotidyltransferase domain-containing protein [Promethearchaeia archaeon]